MPSEPRSFNPDLYYHVYNRSLPEKPKIFLSKTDYSRFLSTVDFYSIDQPLRYAQNEKLIRINPNQIHPKGVHERRAILLAYIVMPNHFHLLIKPTKGNPSGLSRFLSDVANSYTRYFNTKNKRTGVLFQGTFKAKEISDEASLLQVSRYIHLNALVSSKTNADGILKKPQDYPYSSYQEWAGFKLPHIVDEDEIKFWTEKVGGSTGYREFVGAKIKGNPALGIEDLIIEDT